MLNLAAECADRARIHRVKRNRALNILVSLSERTKLKKSDAFMWTPKKVMLPSKGLEPSIPGLGGRCLIHWATKAVEM
jgi:hypothetical protein